MKNATSAYGSACQLLEFAILIEFWFFMSTMLFQQSFQPIEIQRIFLPFERLCDELTT